MQGLRAQIILQNLDIMFKGIAICWCAVSGTRPARQKVGSALYDKFRLLYPLVPVASVRGLAPMPRQNGPANKRRAHRCQGRLTHDKEAAAAQVWARTLVSPPSYALFCDQFWEEITN